MSVIIDLIVNISAEQIALYKTNPAEREKFRRWCKWYGREQGAHVVTVRGPNGNNLEWVKLRKS